MVVALLPFYLDHCSENGSSSSSCASSPDVDLDVDEDTQNIQCMWSHCGAWCPDSKTLTVHITEDHMKREEDGAYYCQWSTCLRKGKGFNARYKMIVHVRTHTRDKPLQCKFCMKKYSRNENLKIHIRSHTGEKPYVCKECGKAFSNSSDKFKHVRTHYEKKPYGCKVAGCTKRYTDPSSLRKHVKTYKHESRLSESSVQTSAPSSPQSTSPLHIPGVSDCEQMDQDLEKESTLRFPSYYEQQTISRPVPRYMFVPLWNLWIPQPAVWPETPLDLATTPLDLSCRVAAASSKQESRLAGSSSPS